VLQAVLILAWTPMVFSPCWAVTALMAISTRQASSAISGVLMNTNTNTTSLTIRACTTIASTCTGAATVRTSCLMFVTCRIEIRYFIV
jgi:hypothetical protein